MRDTFPLLVKTDFPAIRRRMLETLQANLGYRCNQSCFHCHVAAGPKRTEEMSRETMEVLLDFARRKTTQKVNLYEKVQIPGYEDAIRKIKRFMEDEENLSKSAQKIVKTKQQAAGEGAML